MKEHPAILITRFAGFRLSPPSPVGDGYAALPIGARLLFAKGFFNKSPFVIYRTDA